MKIAITAIVSKSPWQTGRVGPRYIQDYYAQCVKAAARSRFFNQPIVVVSATQVAGEKSEIECYAKLANEFHFHLDSRSAGFETVEQLCELQLMARKAHAEEIILIVTWMHYLRVRWICFQEEIPATFIVTGGIPRPKEFLTDLVLTFLYPILDVLGKKDWFLNKVRLRRESGTL